jgi:outer membrane protein assembly factor BamB
MRTVASAGRRGPARWSRLSPLLCVLTAASACSSGSPPVVPSVLSNTSVLTCPSAHRDCTAPGTVRWSVPVQGSYPVDLSDGGGVLDVPATLMSQAEFENTPPDGAHSAAFTDGLAVVCAGGVADGISLASGQVRWRQKLVSASAENEQSQSNPGPQAYCDLTSVASGEVAVANFSPFPNSGAPNVVRILNAATGAVGPQLALPLPPGANDNNPNSSSANVLDLSGGTLSVLVNSQIYGLNEATGAVRWQTALQTFTGYSVVGDILYADTTNDNSSLSVSTALQRVDLSSGATLGPLPLGPGLAGTNLAVIQPGLAVTAAAGPMTTLLVTTGASTQDNGQVAAVDTATGKALWSYPGNLVEIDPASQPPEAAVMQESVPAFGSGSLTLRTVDLVTGKLIATSRVPSRLWPVIDLKPGAEETWWNFYDSALVGEVRPDSSQAGPNTSWYGRLEGLTASGKVRWQGPWSSSDLWVLGGSTAGPPLIIVESCTPAGIVPPPTPATSSDVTTTCTQGRVYAINA